MITAMVSSELADKDFCAISLLVEMGLESAFHRPALHGPRRASGPWGCAEAVLHALLHDGLRQLVAVVVPSPATSAVFDATCLTIGHPCFPNLSFSSISLATDTPSFVIVSAENCVQQHTDTQITA